MASPWKLLKDGVTLPFRVIGSAFTPVKNFITDHKFTSVLLGLYAAPKVVGGAIQGISAIGRSKQATDMSAGIVEVAPVGDDMEFGG